MSYIRCLSNPEGLYIWSDGESVTITGKNIPLFYSIQEKIFDGLIKKYNKNKGWLCGESEAIKYKGAKLFENADFKVVLSYKDWSVSMFFVTWAYIASKGN